MKKTAGNKTDSAGEKNRSPLDKSAEEEIIIAKRMMDGDDKPPKSAAAKKSAARAEREQETRERLKGLPKVVTKDTNTIDLRIDRRVFEAGGNDDDGSASTVSRSRTIDGSMLSQDRLTAQRRKKRKRFVSTD